MRYLMLLWYVVSRPSWARHILWNARFKLAIFNRRSVHRIAEYDQNAMPLGDVLQKACASSPDRVIEELERYEEGALHSDSSRGVIPSKNDATEELAKALYCMVRLTRPSIVVETGVARGVTSYNILRALAENGNGHLYSIDLPLRRYGARSDVGNLVPEWLRARWTLIFGPGVDEMMRLFGTIGSIDMFIHDSDHRYLNQLREYQLALTVMNKGGILVSDDIDTDALADASDKFSCQLMVARHSKSRDIGILLR